MSNRKFSYDKNKIPTVESLLQPILFIMKNGELWKVSRLSAQLANELELSPKVTQLRSNTSSHYLIFSNRVYAALTKLRNDGCITRKKAGKYKITIVGLRRISSSYNLKYRRIPMGALYSKLMPKNIFNPSNIVGSAIRNMPNQSIGLNRNIAMGALTKYSALGIGKEYRNILRASTAGNAWRNLESNRALGLSRNYSEFKMNNIACGAIFRQESLWNKYLKGISPIITSGINKNIAVRELLEKIYDFNLKNTNFGQVSPLIDTLSAVGWCVTEKSDLRLIFLTENKTHREIVKRKDEIYSNRKVMEILQNIIQDSFFTDHSLDGGRKTMLKTIYKILKDDFSKFYLFFGDFFGMCEYVFFQKLHSFFENEKNYLNLSNLKSMNKKVIELKDSSELSLRIMRFYSTIKVMKMYWSPKSHNSFGRDTIQHGFFDPNKMNREDFSKIILLLYSILKLDNPDEILS